MLLGAVQVIVACPSPAATAVIAGADSTAYGVTAFDAALALPVPAAFTAATVNVYEAPTMRSLSVRVFADGSTGIAVCAAPAR